MVNRSICRTRTCPHVDQCSKMGLSFELNSCNEQKCTDSGIFPLYISIVQWSTVGGNNAWLEWNNWSACSVSCGGGMQTRRRTCAFLFRCRGLNAEERPCGNIQCPIVNTVFGQPVQFECESIGQLTFFLTDTIDTVTVPNWSTWSEWSTCSCFTMNKFRRRYCEIIDPNIQGFCSGPIIQQVCRLLNDRLSDQLFIVSIIPLFNRSHAHRTIVSPRMGLGPIGVNGQNAQRIVDRVDIKFEIECVPIPSPRIGDFPLKVNQYGYL